MPVARVELWLAIALVAAIGGCGAPAPRCAIASRSPSGPPLLWRVERPGGAPVWLYGTIHDAGAGDVPRAAWTALDGAAAFASELGNREPDPRKLAEIARLPWGQVLDQMLPADDWWELVNAMLGEMREDELRHARPWFALIRLNARMAQSPRPSMDVALAEHARERRIAVEHLESWEQQLDSLAESVTAADLSAAIHGRHAVACELARLRAAYRESDVPALARMLAGTARSAAEVAERNRRWLPQIERYLAGGGGFVAVGLGHMLGEDGLPALLERAGYSVQGPRGEVPSRAGPE